MDEDILIDAQATAAPQFESLEGEEEELSGHGHADTGIKEKGKSAWDQNSRHTDSETLDEAVALW